MTEKEIFDVRRKLIFEYQRQTFDAFLVGMREMGLRGKDQEFYVMKAAVETIHIVWNAYDMILRSFMDLAWKLLDGYGLSREEMEGIRNKMYVRFLEGRIRFFEHQERLELSPVPPVPVGEADFHNVELAELFAKQQADPEMKEQLSALGVRWEHEQLHMVTWFSSQLTLGSEKYPRSRPNHSARVAYQRMLNPCALLWIAAALGEDFAVVRQAAELAKKRDTFKEKSTVIRNLIPFSRIYELAKPVIMEERHISGVAAAGDESRRVC